MKKKEAKTIWDLIFNSPLSRWIIIHLVAIVVLLVAVLFEHQGATNLIITFIWVRLILFLFTSIIPDVLNNVNRLILKVLPTSFSIGYKLIFMLILIYYGWFWMSLLWGINWVVDFLIFNPPKEK